MNRRTIGNRQLLVQLGRGGMAEVYLAVAKGPAGFDKLVVVKVLNEELGRESEEFIEMFLDEARVAARLNHPNIVQTNEVGRDGDLYFLSMEYLDGQSFQHILSRARKASGRMPEALFLRVLADALEGLHGAHTAVDYEGSPLEIVHRDVSPQNVFVTYEGQVKVVDFGIAKASGRLAQATGLGVLKGRVAYMAPEQIHGDVDARTDVFAAGVILYDYLVGGRMWQDVTDIEVVARLLRSEFPQRPREVSPSVPEALDAICRRALAPAPADRFESARAMRAAIDEYLYESGGAPSPQELGAYVRTLFERERAAITAEIATQYQAMKSTPGEVFEHDIALPDVSGPTSWNGSSLAPSVDSGRPPPERTRARGSILPKPRRSRKLAWALGGLTVGVAGLLPLVRYTRPPVAATPPMEAPAPSFARVVPPAVVVTGSDAGARAPEPAAAAEKRAIVCPPSSATTRPASPTPRPLPRRAPRRPPKGEPDLGY